jgi:hypothetical protein
MGEEVPVSSVKIYNGDVPPRLTNSLVLLKDWHGRILKSYHIGDATGKAVFEFNKNSFAFDVLGYARYVRVKQDDNAYNILHMREVQVFDQNGVNRALPWSCTYRCISRYFRDEFCSGRYNHAGKYYGGCSYVGSYTDCVSSCDSSGYGGSVTLKSGGTETEKQACKVGCGNRGSPLASQSSTQTYNNFQLPASNSVDDELIGVKNLGSMTEYKTGKCQISASIFPWMTC